jgi:hypothetical protein
MKQRDVGLGRSADPELADLGRSADPELADLERLADLEQSQVLDIGIQIS